MKKLAAGLALLWVAAAMPPDEGVSYTLSLDGLT